MAGRTSPWRRAADSMLVCLFDEGGAESQIPLRDYDAGVWHGFLPEVGAGQAYGYRAGGRYDPGTGLRFNPAKLLLDPYARAINGTVSFGPEVLGYAADDPDAPSTLDSAGHVPRSLVIDDTFRWSDGARPRRSYADTIIYEVHVKGFTMRHPGVPEELRGTYAGLGHEAAISHLLGHPQTLLCDHAARRMVARAGGAAGRHPDRGGGGSCTRAPPRSRYTRVRSTRRWPTCATT